MHNRYAQRPNRTIVYASIAQEKAWGCEYPLGDPWGGPAFGEFNKGGFFSSGYWEGGGIVNSVTEFFSDPIGYTGDRLAEFDKTVLQPVGKTLEGIGKAIANDPITFVATVAAVATGNAWMVPIIQGISTAAHGGSIEDVVKTVAISAATTWVGGQVGEFVASGMESGTVIVDGVEKTTYSLMGTAIEKSTATVIGNVVGYSASGALGAAAMGKNGDQILTTALANGAGAALPLVLGNIPGYNDLVKGTVEGIAPDVSKAIANGIAGTAGSIVGAAITGKDISTAAAAGIITAGINGLVSTKNIVTDLFKQGGEAVGISNLSTQTQAIIANTMSSVFATALNGGKAGNALQQSMLAIGNQALQGYITDGIKQGSALVNQYFNDSKNIETEFDTQFERYREDIVERNDTADKINGIVQTQLDLADQYEQADNDLDAFLIKSQGYKDQYDQTYAAYTNYVNKANGLTGTVNAKGKAANDLAGKVNIAAKTVNDAVENQKTYVNEYNKNYPEFERQLNTYNNAIAQDPVVATNRVLGYEYDGQAHYFPPGTQVAYGANGRYSYKTVGPEGYIYFNNSTFGDPIQGTEKYGYAITYGGYTGAELETMRNNVTKLAGDLNTWAEAANLWAGKANTALTDYNTINGQYQTALTDYNKTKTEYDNWSGKATSTLTDVNRIANDLNTVNTNINTTIGTMNDINKQVTDLNTQYTNLSGELKNYDTQIAASEKTLADLKDQYTVTTGKLDEVAKPLTQQINELTSKVTNDLVESLDPNFNAEEYKQINGLGNAIDAATHWLSIGKDQGLYTNKEAADTAKYEAVYGLATAIAKQRGYGSGFDVSDKEWSQLYSDIEAHYGNNIAAIKEATPGTFAWETGKPVSQMLSAFDESKLAENVAEKSTYGAWNAPDNFVTPKGTKLATAEEYASGKATQIQTKDGNIAYVVSDGTQTTKAMGTDGNLVDVPVGATAERGPDGEWTITTEGTGLHITIRGAAGQEEAPGTLETVDPMEQDPLAAMYTFNTMQAGLLGDWSKPGDRIIEGSKAIIAWAEEKAKNGESSNVLAIASNVVGGFGEQFQSFAGLAALVGDKPEDTDLYKLGQKLIDLQKSSTPADFAKRYAEFEAQYQNVTGLEKGWAFIKGAVNYPSEFMMGMVLPEIAQEVIPTLLGAGVGKIAASGAGALASVAPKIAAWASKWAGVTASAASDVAESFGANYNDTYKEAKTLAVKAHPEWSKQQVEEYATNQGLTVGLVGALTTGISMGVGGAELAKSLLGPKASSEAVEGLTGWLGNIAGKLTTTGKIMIKEGVSEAVVEEMPTQLVKDLLFLDIDPNRDIAGNVALAGAQAFTTAGMTTGSISAAHQTALGIAEVALQANDAFMNAINGTNGNATQLGNVLNQWLPMTTTQGAELRDTIVPAIFEQHPDWGLQYATAEDYARTVATLGVKDPIAITDLVDKRFDTAVITGDEAVTDLYNKGLTDVTIGDVKAVLGGGTQTPTQVTNAVVQYVDKNMVDVGEVKAAAGQEGYQYTQTEMDNLVGRGVEAEVIQKFIQEIDPKAVNTAEATQYFKNLGYDKATATDIAQFVKSAPETEVQAAVAAWVDPRQVTRNEAIDFYAQYGYTPTEAEINKYIVQGPDVAQTEVQKQLGEYVDPRFVSADEVRAAFKNLGLAAPVSMSDIARLTGQYDESQLAAKAKEALPIVSSNAAYNLLAGDSFTTKQAADLVNSQAVKYQNAGLDSAAAQKAALESVAAQFGVSKANLLTALGTTEQTASLDLNPTTQDIISKIQQYQAKGISGDSAIQAALDTVASSNGVSVSNLLGSLGTNIADFRTYVTNNVGTEESQLAELAAQKQSAGMERNEAIQSAVNDLSEKLGISRTDLLNKVDITSQQFINDISIAQTDANKQLVALGGQPSASVLTQLKSDIQNQLAAYQQAGIDRDTALSLAISGVTQDVTSVSQLLGKPASQVTANDITMVKNMIAGQTQTNLAYDINQDGKIDINDQVALQTQLDIQNNPNIKQQIDPNTGLNILIDTTTGKPVDTWEPTAGTQWAASGIYDILQKQQEEAANVAKTATEKAKVTQQKTQFGSLMGMLFSAPDAAGQTVSVKTPDPARINYIYDFGSIFANPSQASLMPSPYGAMNTVMPMQPQQRQAANQDLYGAPYKMAVGGFAEGGIVGGNDIQVGGGGSIDDLLNILKGNG